MAATETARALHARAQAHYTAIDADARLTADAKRADKIRTWTKLERDLKAVRDQEQETRATRRQQLERTLFGLPATPTQFDLLAFRDAQERARSIDSEADAARTMRDAATAGDTSLVNAIAAHAISQGWARLTDAYVTELRPDAAQQVNELSRVGGPSFVQDFISAGEFIAFAPPGVNLTDAGLRSEARAIAEADGTEPPAYAFAAVPRSPLEELFTSANAQQTWGAPDEPDAA